MGLVVIDKRGNCFIFGRVIVRYFVRCFFGIILMIGYIIVVFMEKKEVFYDMIVGIIVY